MAFRFNVGESTRRWFEKFVRQTLEAFFGAPRVPKVFISELRLNGATIRGEIMATQIPSDKTAIATISAKDAKGNPAQVESPQWASSDENVFTVTPSEDGTTCHVTPVGAVGSAQLQFTCDADLGEGVKELTGQADIEVVAGEAAVVEIGLTVNE